MIYWAAKRWLDSEPEIYWENEDRLYLKDPNSKPERHYEDNLYTHLGELRWCGWGIEKFESLEAVLEKYPYQQLVKLI